MLKKHAIESPHGIYTSMPWPASPSAATAQWDRRFRARLSSAIWRILFIFCSNSFLDRFFLFCFVFTADLFRIYRALFMHLVFNVLYCILLFSVLQKFWLVVRLARQVTFIVLVWLYGRPSHDKRHMVIQQWPLPWLSCPDVLPIRRSPPLCLCRARLPSNRYVVLQIWLQVEQLTVAATTT